MYSHSNILAIFHALNKYVYNQDKIRLIMKTKANSVVSCL